MVTKVLLTGKVKMKLNLNYHLSESTFNEKSRIKNQLHLRNIHDQAHIEFLEYSKRTIAGRSHYQKESIICAIFNSCSQMFL